MSSTDHPSARLMATVASSSTSLSSSSTSSTSSSSSSRESTMIHPTAPYDNDPSYNEAFTRVVQLPLRNFRTMFRLLIKGLYIDQAERMLQERCRSKLEITTDEITDIISACSTTDPSRLAMQYLASLKVNQTILTVTNEEVYNELYKRCTSWDSGQYPDLGDAHRKRSKEMHILAAERKRARGEDTKNSTTNQNSNHNHPKPNSVEIWAPNMKKSNTDRSTLSSTTTATILSTDPSVLFVTDETLIRNRFRELSIFLNEKLLSDTNVNWTQVRLQRTLQLILHSQKDGEEGLGIKPTARCYVLALYAAVEAQDAVTGKRIMDEFRNQNILPFERLYEIMQPAFIQRLGDSQILTEDEVHTLLHAEPNTTKWFFLKAAYEAMKGDQWGSKHGAVLIKDNKYISYGHNHRFGVPDDLHLRVMHSEIHSIVRMCKESLDGGRFWTGKILHKPTALVNKYPVVKSNDISLLRSIALAKGSSENTENSNTSVASTNDNLIGIQKIPSTVFSWPDFIGSEIFIVELDGLNIGYECAVPCPMCNKGLIKLGISKAYYSSLDGIESSIIRHRSDIVCESLDLAVKRIYPEGTTNPDMVYVTPQQLIRSLEEYDTKHGSHDDTTDNSSTSLFSSPSSVPFFIPSYLRDDQLNFNEVNDPGRRRGINNNRKKYLLNVNDNDTANSVDNSNEKQNNNT